MKIFPIDKVRQADEYTIKNEPVASIDLMERAATKCYEWLTTKLKKGQRVMVFCGPGNNGGDGLVVARLLGQDGYRLEAFAFKSENHSEDFSINHKRLKEVKSVKVEDIDDNSVLPELLPDDVVVDAIFGSGLTRPTEDFPAKVIRHINNSKSVVVAIDIPSGLFADRHSDEKKGAIIHADYTLSFQFPKLAFMFAENDGFVGEWSVHPIGLLDEFIDTAETKNFLLTPSYFHGQAKKRGKFSHKGHYGHALLIAGGYGKMGAAVLASKACLHSGVGLLHAHIPRKGYDIIQTAVPETMVSIDPHEEFFSEVPELGQYSAIGIGPGIGFDKKTINALKLLIQNTPVPLLFDADALTILGENKTWLSFVPRNSVFTPHPREFERVSVKARDDFHRHELQREFAVKYGAYVVLKGAHTAICFPDGTCYFNTTGNPGMATGGSGDVLTGIILGLLAQRYTPAMACLLGVYLHGLAGDLAARKSGMESMIAGDMVKKMGKAFKKIDKISEASYC